MKIYEFFARNMNDFLVCIISTFFCFLIAFFFCSIHRIRLSKKIALSVNVKKDGEWRLAWKFKIVNTSIFTGFANFDIKLVGINYVRNSDNTLTQHRDAIEVFAGVRRLTRYIPRPILFVKRLMNPDYTISFAYRPVTFENLEIKKNEYESLELSVSCVDTLTGRPHVYLQEYPLSKRSILEGNFTNDGRLRKILPLTDEEKEFVSRHKNEKKVTECDSCREYGSDIFMSFSVDGSVKIDSEKITKQKKKHTNRKCKNHSRKNR